MNRSGETLAALGRDAESVLRAAGCPEPEHDAEALIRHAFGQAHHSQPHDLAALVPPGVAERARRLVQRRADRVPLAYILGYCEFRALKLRVDDRVLVPQPRFGILVDLALPLPPRHRVHDVGTGSGALALAIKNERPDLVVTGSDLSAPAVEVARSNATRLGLDVAFTVYDGLPPGAYDLVVAHLPYVDDAERTLPIPPEEAKYQPHIAVYAGRDGLDIIRHFLAGLTAPVTVALGHAPSQGDTVRRWLDGGHTVKDSNQEPRYTIGRAVPTHLSTRLNQETS